MSSLVIALLVLNSTVALYMERLWNDGNDARDGKYAVRNIKIND